MDELTKATLRVVIDAQAVLWGELQKIIAESNGVEFSDDQFKECMNEWKLDTAELIEAQLGGTVEQA